MNDMKIPEAPRATSRSAAQSAGDEETLEVLIVGAGFAGLGAAIRLRQAGVEKLLILERGEAVGGTWRDNQYPGAACDIPSHLYSFSFAPNPDWSRRYAGAAEILDYVHALVARYQLQERLRLRCEVTALDFDAASNLWTVQTAAGTRYRARCVVMAQGPLSNASLPKIAGIERFAGHKIHSARWDHDYDFRGKRVAVIGTGASAVQIVPELVRQAAQVKVFQRTPAWVLPRPDAATAPWLRTLFRRLPRAQSAYRGLLFALHEAMAAGVVWTSPVTSVFERLSRAWLRSQVRDPWLRRQLTPDFRLGCKRVLVSNDWYRSLQADNCQLISWPIATLAENGIRTVEGIEHQVDCIVFATGFDVSKSGAPFAVRGLEGFRLDQDWARGAQAFKSVSVSGYPNLFLTFGPNSGPGHNSALVYMEAQIDYIVQGVREILRQPQLALDVPRGTQSRYNAAIQKRLRRTNWNSGCRSWYLTEDGFNPTMYPGFATQYQAQMRRFRAADYQRLTLPEASAASSKRASPA